MTDVKHFNSPDPVAWCPGCGNHALLKALKQTLAELEKKPHEVLICSGIGQAAKTPHYINVNGFNGLHGRAVPPAFAAKVANKDLTVIINTGDGDTYGEGGNHLIHSMRRNVNIAHFVHDNQIYGLTKGQASPTTRRGHKTEVQRGGSILNPESSASPTTRDENASEEKSGGVILRPVSPLALALTMGVSFVARGFVGEHDHLVGLMKAAIQHPGYALLDIFQPCVVYNKVNTFKWYKENTYMLPDDYDPSSLMGAMEKAFEWDDGIPLGILYQKEKYTYHDRIETLWKGDPLVDRELKPDRVVQFFDDYR